MNLDYVKNMYYTLKIYYCKNYFPNFFSNASKNIQYFSHTSLQYYTIIIPHILFIKPPLVVWCNNNKKKK